ncbi:hypothetical protein TYRP_020444 [Tyrophagus putrescentiae]|nr:hypothetical protein TYRP_020444 [Tyrophagus putrescentiae]
MAEPLFDDPGTPEEEEEDTGLCRPNIIPEGRSVSSRVCARSPVTKLMVYVELPTFSVTCPLKSCLLSIESKVI